MMQSSPGATPRFVNSRAAYPAATPPPRITYTNALPILWITSLSLNNLFYSIYLYNSCFQTIEFPNNKWTSSAFNLMLHFVLFLSGLETWKLFINGLETYIYNFAPLTALLLLHDCKLDGRDLENRDKIRLIWV